MIRKIELINFRNYESREIEFLPGKNIVIGDNGRGKTNLLEAIFFLLQGSSMRTSDHKEIIREGYGEAAVEGVFEAETEIVLRSVINREGGIKSRGRATGIRAVCFQPDDIWMVKGGPEERRKGIDGVAAELRRGYRETLRDYQRVLRQRNEAIRAVRKGARGKEDIRTWNPMLVEYGSTVTAERISTLRGMQKEMEKTAERWGRGKVELKYYSSMGDPHGGGGTPLERVERMEEAEIRRGATLVGPHRDEIVIHMAGKSVRRECSQGEQKLAVLMWRLAQASLAGEMSGAGITLLLDDCLSELDRKNRGTVLEELREWRQTIITSTDDMEEFRDDWRIYI